MRFIIKCYFFLFLICFVSRANSQVVSSFELSLNLGDTTLNLNAATSICYRASDMSQFTSVRFVYQNQTLQLLPDEHAFDLQSELLIFSEPQSSIRLSTLKSCKIQFFVITAPALIVSKSYKTTVSLKCKQPKWISPSVWRQGLPDPKPGRTISAVQHCIVHHSAGANFSADYYNVVRNIYLLHTQTNGWDDIGYNYLIAPDGTLFQGRDALGAGDPDNIIGAHFCAKNSNTMGTCMIGTYTDTLPTDTALSLLKHVLTWKLFKEHLQTSDSFVHPVGGTDYLGTIAGHRDGCSTECPGEKLYAILPQLSISVQKELNDCTLSGISPETKSDIQILCNGLRCKFLNNQVNGQLMLYEISGKLLLTSSAAMHQTEFMVPNPGIYYLLFRTDSLWQYQKFSVFP